MQWNALADPQRLLLYIETLPCIVPVDLNQLKGPDQGLNVKPVLDVLIYVF